MSIIDIYIIILVVIKDFGIDINYYYPQRNYIE